jgi:hypothetical protein
MEMDQGLAQTFFFFHSRRGLEERSKQCNCQSMGKVVVKKMKKRNSNERAKGKGAVAGTACGLSRDSLCLSLIALVPFHHPRTMLQ